MENSISINDISDESEVLVPTRNAEEKQRKKKHKLIKILVIIVIVVALLFLAYYLFWKHQEKKYADPLKANDKLLEASYGDNGYVCEEGGYTYQVGYFDFPKWDWALNVSVFNDTVVDENWNLLTDTRVNLDVHIDILGKVKYYVQIAELTGDASGIQDDNFGAYYIDSDGNMLECLGEDDNKPFNNMADNYYEKHKAEVIDMLNKLYDFFGKDNLVL